MDLNNRKMTNYPPSPDCRITRRLALPLFGDLSHSCKHREVEAHQLRCYTIDY